MVDIEIWIAFVVAATALNFLPGPSMMLVIARALARGSRAATGTILGIVVGDAMLIVLSLFGVGVLLATSAEIFFVLKWIGAIYLIYLGIQQWRSDPRAQADTPSPRRYAFSGFAQGVVVTLLNPKVIAFNIAFFPQFLDPDAPLAPQMIILGATFLVLAAGAMAVYAVTADQARKLSRGTLGSGIFNKVSGSVLIASGLFMASLKRGA